MTLQVKDSVWRGYFGYWRRLFIRENLRPLRHDAWRGYIQPRQEV